MDYLITFHLIFPYSRNKKLLFPKISTVKVTLGIYKGGRCIP